MPDHGGSVARCKRKQDARCKVADECRNCSFLGFATSVGPVGDSRTLGYCLVIRQAGQSSKVTLPASPLSDHQPQALFQSFAAPHPFNPARLCDPAQPMGKRPSPHSASTTSISIAAHPVISSQKYPVLYLPSSSPIHQTHHSHHSSRKWLPARAARRLSELPQQSLT